MVDDPIPAGTTPSESEADCAIAAGTFTCTTTVPLAPGASASYQLTLAVPANSVLVSLVNTATITSTPIADPNAGNDTATDTDTVTTSADLAVVKTDSADPISPGDVLDYVITVTNNGPSDAQNLTVTDSVPAPGSFSITGIVASAGACGNVGNDVTCTLGTLVPGATWTITISILLDPATPGGLYTDTATVTSTTPDPVPGNNSDAESTVVFPRVDMVVTKTDGVASVAAGTSTTYTITLTNGGPSTAPAGVVVSDPIPAGTVGSESEPNCVIAAGTFTCTTTAPIAPFGSVSYQLTLFIPPGYASATVANTASITFNPIAETDPTDDSATDVDTVTSSADLAITKTDLADPVLAGDDVDVHHHRDEPRPLRRGGRRGHGHASRLGDVRLRDAQPGELRAGGRRRHLPARRGAVRDDRHHQRSWSRRRSTGRSPTPRPCRQRHPIPCPRTTRTARPRR